MHRHRMARIADLVLLVAATGCSASAGSPGTATSGALPTGAGGSTKPGAPPAPASTNPACVISADCPAGQHCDLEQCVQDCSTATACAGDQTCSPRARCVAPGTEDEDPKPTGQSQGTLLVAPTNVLLASQDDKFVVTLRSTGTQPVRYRIALSGPHLSVARSTSSFTGSTNITIGVDTSKIKGQNAVGTVSLYTTLGDAVVNAPVHVGVRAGGPWRSRVTRARVAREVT